MLKANDKQKKMLERNMEEFPANKYNSHAWIRGKPEVAEDVWIGAFTVIDAAYQKLVIGKGCDIASGAQILTHSTLRRIINEKKIMTIDTAPVEIGDHCFIGSNAVILMGVKIGHHSVVGAGCVIPQFTIIPPYSLVMGVPGKVVGSSKKYLLKKRQAKIVNLNNV